MKKLLLILTLSASSFAFASATTIDPVSQRTLKSFKTDFSTANDVKWVTIEASQRHSGFGWCRNFKGFKQYRAILGR